MSKVPVNSPEAIVLKTLEEMRALVAFYAIAVDIQHEKPRKGGSGGGRQKGTHSDPTLGAMLDPRPAGVRQAVRRVDGRILRIHDDVLALKSQLLSAIDKWDA